MGRFTPKVPLVELEATDPDRVLEALVRTRDEAIEGDRHVTGNKAHGRSDYGLGETSSVRYMRGAPKYRGAFTGKLGDSPRGTHDLDRVTPRSPMNDIRQYLRELPVFAGDLPGFEPGSTPADPVTCFHGWLASAVAAGVREPHAMTLVDAR